MTFANALLAAFIPLFVAMDPIGVLPTYTGFMEGVEKKRKKKILNEAVATAGLAGLFFLFLGKAVFRFLGITVSDFKIAGGLILLILAVQDLLFSEKKRGRPADTVGVVPLGLPLIVGPAVLTTLMIQLDAVGLHPTIIAFAVNLLLIYITFRMSNLLIQSLGKSGTQAVSKVANLLLAAIAVMMIRKGIVEIGILSSVSN
jgi:multiple antibiotic resistance protein